MNTLTIRKARVDDLPQVYDILYENEVRDDPTPPPLGTIPAELRHELETSEMYVADQNGRVLGFTALTTRGSIAYLSELFVRRSEQSHHVGTTLRTTVWCIAASSARASCAIPCRWSPSAIPSPCASSPWIRSAAASP